jgi:hypothetical protein
MKVGWSLVGASAFVAFLAIGERGESNRGASSVSVQAEPTFNDAMLVAVEPIVPDYRLQESRAIYRTRTIAGDDCTMDCSGHEAGYEWAEEHGIEDPDDCGGNSASFIEGCQAYAAEQSGVDDKEDADKDDE